MFKNMKVAVLMSLNAALALLAILLIAGVSLSGVRTLAEMQDSGFSRSKDALLATAGAGLGAESDQIIADAVINRNLDETARDWDAIKSKARNLFEQLQAAADTDEKKRLIGEAIQAHGNMATLFEQRMLPLLREAEPDGKAVSALDGEIDTQAAIVNETLSTFAASMSKEAVEADAHFGAVQDDIFAHNAMIVTAALLLLLSASWWITRSITRPIGEAVSVANHLVAQINTAMNQLNQLNQITQQNASSSEELAATAEEMSSQAEQLQQTMSFFKVRQG